MDLIKFAVIGGIVSMLGYGVSDFFAKKTVDRIGSFLTIFYVQLIGIAFLALYFLYDKSLPVFSLNNLLGISIFGVLEASVYFALYRAFELGKISIVSPISSSYAIVAAIVSFIFFGEQVTTIKIVSIAVIVLGIILTAYSKTFFSDLKKSNWANGVPEAFFVLLVNGAYLPFWNEFISNSGWAVWLFLRRVVMTMVLFAYIVFVKKKKLSFRGKGIWKLLLVITAFEAVGSFGGTWGFHFSVNETSIVAALGSTYPMITIILARLFLGEKLEIYKYFGIAMILLGLFSLSIY